MKKFFVIFAVWVTISGCSQKNSTPTVPIEVPQEYVLVTDGNQYAFGGMIAFPLQGPDWQNHRGFRQWEQKTSEHGLLIPLTYPDSLAESDEVEKVIVKTDIPKGPVLQIFEEFEEKEKKTRIDTFLVDKEDDLYFVVLHMGKGKTSPSLNKRGSDLIWSAGAEEKIRPHIIKVKSFKKIGLVPEPIKLKHRIVSFHGWPVVISIKNETKEEISFVMFDGNGPYSQNHVWWREENGKIIVRTRLFYTEDIIVAIFFKNGDVVVREIDTLIKDDWFRASISVKKSEIR